MKTKNVTITITATTGAGKSILTRIICDHLKELGFDVEIKDIDHPTEKDFYDRTNKYIGNALKVLPETTKILINQVQASRLEYDKQDNL